MRSERARALRRWVVGSAGVASVLGALSASAGPTRRGDEVSEVAAAMLPGADLGARRVAEVLVPARASEPLLLRESASGVSIALWLDGAREARLQRRGGVAVYAGALGAGHYVLRETARGVEDHVLLEGALPASELRYEIELGEGASSLRQVEGVLEVLDEGGAPRLRVPRPVLVDAKGAVRAASIEVEGCEVDRDARAPHGRVTKGSSRRCRLALRYDDAGLAYPLLIDPAWESTSFMAKPRVGHTATLLSDGRVLVAGGRSAEPGGAFEATCEIYDPATGTFAVTGSLGVGRASHVAALLGSGEVLVAGGLSAEASSEASAERWSPVSGVYSPAQSMGQRRAFASVSVLGTGKVLVLGGVDAAAPATHATGEIYDASTDKWNGTPPMPVGRSHHVAVALGASGALADRVLVAGGRSDEGGTAKALKDAYVYDDREPSPSLRWSTMGSMAAARLEASAVLLGSGDVLVAGGCTDALPTLSPCTASTASAELFDRKAPVSSSFGAAGALQQARAGASAVRLLSGGVLVLGGATSGSSLSTAEAFDGASKAFSAAADLKAKRRGAAAVRTSSGDVILFGGLHEGVGLDTVERLRFVPLGGACTDGGACAYGHCVDGVCCDSACDGPCVACKASEKASGAQTGRCGPALSGTNPHGLCVAAPAEVCGLSGVCGEAGECAAKVGDTCGPPACDAAGSAIIANRCAAPDKCVPEATSCGAYRCVNAACPLSCQGDSDCASGHHCVGGACVEKTGLGAPCGEGNSCLSGHCVDGVCCDSACDKACSACSAETKQSGAGAGQCGVRKAGLEGGCAAGKELCSGTSTLAWTCAGTTQTACVSAKVKDCDPKKCIDGVCVSDCIEDKICGPNGFCLGGQCEAKRDLGAECSGGAMCASGQCVEGVCCENACNQGCFTCRKAQQQGEIAEGKCKPAKVGPDPRQTCQGNICVEHSLRERRCNGMGACEEPEIEDCAPGRCVDKKCVLACTKPGDCQPGDRCDGGVCVKGKLQAGDPCVADAQCSTLFCADGVCCNGRCQGECERCDLAGAEGVCTALPPRSSPKKACDGVASGPCALTCMGRSGCEVPVGDRCGASTCAGDAVVEPVCGAGSSCAPRTAACPGSLACDPATGACRSSCSRTEDCLEGYACNASGACEPGSRCHDSASYATQAGQLKACRPGRRCQTRDPEACARVPDCQSSADCVVEKGFVCHADGSCGPPVSPSDSSAGCSMGSREGERGGLLVLGALALVITRARRRSRS